MSPIVDAELLQGFVVEVREYLVAIRREFAALPTPARGANLEEFKRGAHTIKGASAMLGFDTLSHCGFELEGIAERLTSGQVDLSPELKTGLQTALARLDEYLTTVQDGSPSETIITETRSLLAGLATDAEAVSYDSPLASPSAETALDLPRLFGDVACSDTAVDLLPPIFGEDPVAVPEVHKSDLESGHVPIPEASVELLEVFRLEAEEVLKVLTTLLPEVKSSPDDVTRWQEIRRAAHTIKGSAAMVGFRDVTRLAHVMEDLLDAYFEGQRQATPAEIDLLLSGTDCIEDEIAGRSSPQKVNQLVSQFEQLSAADSPTETKSSDTPAVLADAVPETLAEARTSQTETELSIRIPMERLSEFSNLVGEQVIARSAYEQRLLELSRLLNELQSSSTRLRRASDRLERSFESATLGGGKLATRLNSFAKDDFDDLEMDRYTEFHLVSRELAETATDLQTLSGELGYTYAEFEGYLTRQSRLSSEMEEKITRLRMVPLSSIASKLNRTVRNAASSTGKDVQLIFEGERTGLDKTVLEAMSDAFLHLLRNAVDHGLETPEVRLALGKPGQGTIRVRAEHVGSQFQITIRDDGRGIDPDRVREAAVRRNVIDEATAAGLELKQVYELLFQPGFSTRDDVSELSGRGVGLDVVRSKVTSLKGSVEIDSTQGRGTAFIIRLPLTLAVIKSLMVSCGGQKFAIPLEAVERILSHDQFNPEQIGSNTFLRIDGAFYPVVHLSRRLNLESQPEEALRRSPVVVIRAGGHRAAIVVDALHGGKEIVVKRLGPLVHRNKIVSGATLTGDGGVLLILSPEELARAEVTSSPTRTRTTTASKRRGLSVLVVDDSPSVRRVLTTLIERNGWTVTTAKDGMEALDILQQGQFTPDIVLTDVEMPRMDGYELLGTLRGQPSTRTIPVVVITSRAANRHRQKALDLGASAYVVKPYQDDSLIEIIQQLTRTRSTQVS
jgi:chemosensory pili system protein ChpA (sensor histidine kinase/response regulator)